jgi:hypothetical protein
MVISYIHLICWRMKSEFYERQQRVGRVANLCVTCSGLMHLTRTSEMRGYRIIQLILDNLRIVTVACYLVSVLCVFLS